MAKARKVDVNQSEIVASLRFAAATVTLLHAVGSGCPDLLVGYRGRNYLLEVKNPDVRGRKHEFTPHEQEWMATWKGEYAVVYSAEDALRLIGAIE